MTVASTTNKTSSFAAGVSSLPFTMPVFNQDDLDVLLVNATTKVETKLTRGTDYTVTLLYSGAGGGTITLDATLYPLGIPVGSTGYVKRVLDETQEIDLKNQGDWFPEQHEEAFDRAVMLIQQLQEQEDRALHTDNAGTFWDAQNKRIVNLANGTGANDAVNLGQMQSGDAATYTSAVAAAFAAMTAWVISYIASYWPSITPVSASDVVVPSTQQIAVNQTRIYFPVPIYGIILAADGEFQGRVKDFNFTAGNNYVDLTWTPSMVHTITAFIYTSATGLTSSFAHLLATASPGDDHTDMPAAWTTGIVCYQGSAQAETVNFTHVAGTARIDWLFPVVTTSDVLVIKLS
jgi:hypothetical protein